jgi:hypothetical protein
MNSTMRELEPRELEAVIGGALYGAAATAFRLPGRSPGDGVATGGSADAAVLRRRAS